MLFLEKKQKFKYSVFEFEFEFSWNPCYVRKKGKVLVFLLGSRIRILLVPILFMRKGKVLIFSIRIRSRMFAGTHVILGKNEKFKFSVFEFEFEFCWRPFYFRRNRKV